MQSNIMSELLLLTYLEGATDSPLRHTKSHPSYYITNTYVHQIYYNTSNYRVNMYIKSTIIHVL